jgi:hypothetical protein
VNGEHIDFEITDNVVILDRTWNEGDVVDLHLPMEIRFSRWYERSLGIERGPLVYALRIEEDWREVKIDQYPDSYFEVYPLSPWNYGIQRRTIDPEKFQVQVDSEISDMPWNLANAPVVITTTGKQVPFWKLYGNSTGKIPYSPHPLRRIETPEEQITLIPYGCTTLRIAQFPVIERQLK